MSIEKVQARVIKLKKENDVTILCHYYQPIEIQTISDYIGDSLELSRLAKEKANTKYIIFAGVDFMAETASILNQDKHVIIPNPESCCPMANFLNPEMVRKFKRKYPGLPAVVYVNSTAAVKAESDICCSSSTAAIIAKRISKEFNSDAILFGPDANLADFVEQKSGVKTIKMPENGHCYIHSQITIENVLNARKVYPNAKILVHPECIRGVRDLSDFVGSTSQIYNRVKESFSNELEYVIGTERGLIERMALDFPEKKFYPISDKIICVNMKKNTIELMQYVLEHLDDKQFEIKVPSNIAKKALKPIEKMIIYSKSA